MKQLQKLNAFNEDIDVRFYDVLGDVVCGGFSVPLRKDYADEVYIVSSGEYMSLYAANNISRGIKKLKGQLGGIILNKRNVNNEEEIVNAFAEKIGTKVVGVVERSGLIQDAELDAKTVVEKYPDSDETSIYKKLGKSLIENSDYTIPEPIDDEEFEEFFKFYSKN